MTAGAGKRAPAGSTVDRAASGGLRRVGSGSKKKATKNSPGMKPLSAKGRKPPTPGKKPREEPLAELYVPEVTLGGAQEEPTAGSAILFGAEVEVPEVMSDGNSPRESAPGGSSFADRYAEKLTAAASLRRMNKSLSPENDLAGSMRMWTGQVTLESSVADLTAELSKVRKELKDERAAHEATQAENAELLEFIDRMHMVHSLKTNAKLEGSEMRARKILQGSQEELWGTLFRLLHITEPPERPMESINVVLGSLENNEWIARADIDQQELFERSDLKERANPVQAARRLAEEHERASLIAQLQCQLSQAETASLIAEKRSSQLQGELAAAKKQIAALKAQPQSPASHATDPQSPVSVGTPTVPLARGGGSHRVAPASPRPFDASPKTPESARGSRVRDSLATATTYHRSGSDASPPADGEAGYMDYQQLYRQHHAKVQGETQARAVFTRETRGVAGSRAGVLNEMSPARRSRSQPASPPGMASPGRTRAVIPRVTQSPQPLLAHKQYRARSMLARPLTAARD